MVAVPSTMVSRRRHGETYKSWELQFRKEESKVTAAATISSSSTVGEHPTGCSLARNAADTRSVTRLEAEMPPTILDRPMGVHFDVHHYWL